MSVVELLAAVLGFSSRYTIEVETDPFAVVSRAMQCRPDLIILDIKMPGIDGIEVAKGLRQQPGLCHTPIVFYSGVPELREKALKAAGEGKGFFAQKGSPILEIETLVGKLLGERFKVLRDSAPAWARRRATTKPDWGF